MTEITFFSRAAPEPLRISDVGNVTLTTTLAGGVDVGERMVDWADRLRARGAEMVSPALVEKVSRNVNRYAAPLLSAAVLAAALWQFHLISWRTMAAMLPHSPLFWLAFLFAHTAPIVADWLIYRRLWGIPASGMLPLARKMIGNNLLFGYAGEAYLYAWAKGRGVCGAAFGAVKDVAILSAAVGNATTIVVTLIALPFMGVFGPALPMWILVPSLFIIAVPPLTALALRNRLFSRSPAELGYVAAVHGGRAAISILMTGLLWQLALPGVALLTWVVLSALKLLVTRLPLVSQKDVVFAGVSVMLLGKGTDAAALIALMATLSIAFDVTLGIVTAALGLADGAGRRPRAADEPVLAAA